EYVARNDRSGEADPPAPRSILHENGLTRIDGCLGIIRARIVKVSLRTVELFGTDGLENSFRNPIASFPTIWGRTLTAGHVLGNLTARVLQIIRNERLGIRGLRRDS